MKKVTKSVLVGLIAIALVLAMAGCGKKDDKTRKFDKNTVYKEIPINVDLPENFEGNSYYYVGDHIFFTGYTYNNKTYESTSYWGRVQLDGSNLILTKNDDSIWIDGVYGTSDGNTLLSYGKYVEVEDPELYGNTYYFLDLVDDTNKVIKSFNLQEDFGIDYFTEIIVLDGKIYAVGSDEYLYTLDNNLNVASKTKYDNTEDFGYLLKIRDGSYVSRTWGEDGVELKRFDINSLTFGEKIEIPFYIGNYSLYEGSGSGYDFLLSDNTSYYGYNIGDTEPTEILNFVNSDMVDNNFRLFVPTEDGSFFGVNTTYEDDKTTTSFNKYVKVNPEDIKDKDVITLGCVWAESDIRKEVVKFNKSHDDVRIVIIDYESYVTEEDYMASYKKLNSDIASGNAPDIIVSTFDEKFAGYAKKGLFVDLYSMLDKDPDLKKEDFCENVLNVLSENGKLFCLADSFAVRTVIGKKSVLNNRTSWTLDEMIQLEKSLPENSKLFFDCNRASFLNSMISADFNHYIDSVNGKCNFNNDDFIKLLEYCKNLPEADEDYYNNLYGDDYYMTYETMYRDNSVILNELYFSEPSDLPYMINGRFGENVSFIGYPCSEGNGSGLIFNRVYSISSKSKNKDAAWEFVKENFYEEAQNEKTWYMPVIRKALDKRFEEATKPRTWINYETGEEEIYEDTYYIGGVEIVIDPLSTEVAKEIEDFVLSINKRSSYMSDDISNIIEEEVAPFYNNQKTAADVANIIQSRVSILLAEQQ